MQLGRREEAVPIYRELLEFTRSHVGGPYFAALGRTYHLLESLGRYEEAEVLRREEIELIRSEKYRLPEVEPRLFSELAKVIAQQGRFDEARRLHAEAVEKSRLLFGDGRGAT